MNQMEQLYMMARVWCRARTKGFTLTMQSIANMSVKSPSKVILFGLLFKNGLAIQTQILASILLWKLPGMRAKYAGFAWKMFIFHIDSLKTIMRFEWFNSDKKITGSFIYLVCHYEGSNMRTKAGNSCVVNLMLLSLNICNWRRKKLR